MYNISGPFAGELQIETSSMPEHMNLIAGFLPLHWDKTARRWRLKAGKDIEEARDVCEEEVWSVAVSRDGQ